MNQFSQQWAAMDSLERLSTRKDMERAALEKITLRLGFTHTQAQLKAAAGKMVDIAISRARHENEAN